MSLLALYMTYFALMTRVFKATGSNTAVSVLVLSFTLSAVIFSLPGGVYADRQDRRKILIWTNFFGGLAMLGYLLIGRYYGLIYPMIFINATISQFYIPAEAASIPRVVSQKDLSFANALFLFTNFAAFIVGFGIAGPVIGLLGETVPYWLGAGMLFLAAAICLFLPKMATQAVAVWQWDEVFHRLVSDIKEAFQVIASFQMIIFPLLQIIIAYSVLMVIMVLAPGFLRNVVGVDVVNLSHLIIWPAGLGMAVGAAASGRLSVKISKLRLTKMGLLVSGLILIILTFYQTISFLIYSSPVAQNNIFSFGFFRLFPLLMILFFIFGLAGAFVYVPAMTLLQEKVVGRLRGRIYSVMNLFNNLIGLLPVMLGGVLADIFSVKFVLFFLGILILSYIIALPYIWRYPIVRTNSAGA